MSNVVEFVNKEREIKVGDKTYIIKNFNVYKTFYILEQISTLIAESNLGMAFVNNNSRAEMIAKLAAQLPTFFKTSKPTLRKLIGATVSTNKEIADLDENDGDLNGVMMKKGHEVMSDDAFDLDIALDFVVVSVELMRLDTIRKKAPAMLKTVQEVLGTV